MSDHVLSVPAYPEMIALKGSQVSIPCNVSHLAAHVVPAPSKPLGVVAPQHTQQSLRSPSSFTSYDAGEQQQQRPQAEPYHSAKVAQDSPQLILWYHGNDISGSPIYTLDGRDLAAPLSGAHDGDASPENQTMRHFVAPDYQHRARIDLSGHPVQLLLDAVDVNDTGTYWCRVDFRWTRTLISMMQLKVHGKPFLLFNSNHCDAVCDADICLRCMMMMVVVEPASITITGKQYLRKRFHRIVVGRNALLAVLLG